MGENKEEAIRAKIVAQTKMEKKDFSSALGLAVKAQQLYPDLEDISHIILVCDVLCSAKKKVNGNENDWYAILKVEATADEATIRKQYRKFALNLHPDKNKFTGASEAFNLISEAQKVLLDRSKRLVYDMKLRTASSNIRRVNYEAYSQSDVKRQPPYQNSGLNRFASKYNNPQQQQKSESVNDGSTFWTTCPHCLSMFMYYKNILGGKVACHKCKMTFAALENKPRFTSPIRASMQREETGIDNPKQASESVPEVYSKVELKKDVSDIKTSESPNGFTTVTVEASRPKTEYSNVESKSNRQPNIGKSGSRILKKRKFTVPGKVCSKVEMQKEGDKKHSRVKDGVTPISGEFFKPKDENSNVESTTQETNYLSESNSRINKKRKMKKSDPNYEEKPIPGNGDRVIEKKPASSESCTNVSGQPRESVSYDTYLRKNDLSGTPEKQVGMETVNDNAGLCVNTEENQIKIMVKERSLSKEGSQHGAKDAEKEFQKYPNFKFRNFDDLRDKAIFETGQIWALYDTLDAMPRFYAIITKVSSPDFIVDLTWLEPDPDHEEEIKWIEAGLPVSCGKFRCGNSEIITDIAIFSHLVYWEKSSREGTYEVHPRRGETWALFKDWDINWYASSETKKKYAYEYVEVLSDYSSAEGVYVAFLTNLGGFSCVFGREKEGSSAIVIPAKEKFRFSHEVPSFKMTEKESNKLVNWSFELDPASLPTHEYGTVFSEGSIPVDKEVHPSSLYSQPSVDLAVNGKEKPEGYAVKEDIESIRKLDIPVGGFDKVEGKQKVGSSESIENQNLASNLLSDMEATHISPIAHKLQVKTKSACNATSTQDATRSASKFYNFDQDKSPDKFRTGQIWAIYRNAATAPKYYGKIRQIDPFPAFKIHVTWLQTFSPPEEKISSVNKEITIVCGEFKFKPGRGSQYTNTDLFSHQVKAEPSDKKNVYVIFPKKGEIWAMYRDCKKGLNDYKCEIVEVMEESEIFLTVSILEPIGGFKCVFRPRVEGKPNVQIYRTELFRFSHQIPAYRLTEENGGHLHGLWELNAAALQNYLLHT